MSEEIRCRSKWDAEKMAPNDHHHSVSHMSDLRSREQVEGTQQAPIIRAFTKSSVIAKRNGSQECHRHPGTLTARTF